MNGFFENKFKNIKLNTIRDATFPQQISSNLSNNTKSFNDFTPGQTLSGTILTLKQNGDAIFNTEDGNILLNNAYGLKKGDEILVQVIVQNGEVIGKVLSHNTSNEKTNNINRNIHSALQQKSAINVREAWSKNIDPKEIIELSYDSILQEGEKITLKVDSINNIKFFQLVKQLQILLDQLDNQLSTTATADGKIFLEEAQSIIDNFGEYFDQKITLEQSKILIDKLKALNLNSTIECEVVKLNVKDEIDTLNLSLKNNDQAPAEGDEITQAKAELIASKSSEQLSLSNEEESEITQNVYKLTINNNKIIFTAKVKNEGNKLNVISDIGVFEGNYIIPDKRLDTITLELVNVIGDTSYEPSNMFNLNKLLELDGDWKNLEQLFDFDFLNSIDKDEFDKLLPVPSFDNRFLVKAINFQEAIKDGRIEELLNINESNKIYKIDNSTALQGLIEDVQNIQQLNKNLLINSPNAWQFMIIPIYDNNQFEYIRSFVRRESVNSSEMRFIVEFTTKITGNLQLDGFIRFSDSKKVNNFNLIVRSSITLPQNLSESITDIFNNNQLIQGIKGYIRFETVSNFPVNPAQDIISQMLTLDRNFLA